MNKKLHLSILYVILLSLLIGSTILFIKAAEKGRDSNVKSTSNKAQVNVNVAKNTAKIEPVKKEKIDIANNHDKLDLKAVLTENRNGQVTFELIYKINGKTVTKTLNADQIPEIRSLFRLREQYKSGYRLEHLTVNKNLYKIYFKVVGKQNENYQNTTIYSYDLKSSKVKKILYNPGKFSEFFISQDGKYNAFSFTDKLNDKNAIILQCKNDSVLFDGIKNNSSLYSYGYDFINWRNSSSCTLKELILVKDGSRKIEEKTVYYDAGTGKLSY